MISYESVLASATLGYCIGFGYLTAWDAFKLTRQARNPARNLFAWMVWGEITVCMLMTVFSWVLLHGLIKASVASLFVFLLLWALSVHFILQIIINRIALISSVQTTISRVRIATAVFIALVQITVIATFIPTALGVKSIMTGGEVWVKLAKIIIMFTDAFLNFYFISEVKDNLVRYGLQKYDRLAKFNMGIIIVSVLFDLFLFATTFLPGVVIFICFIPVTYITKLKIELSMTELIKKIAAEGMHPRHKASIESSTTAVSSSGPSSFGQNSSIGGGSAHAGDSVSNFGMGVGMAIGGPVVQPSYQAPIHPPSRFSVDEADLKGKKKKISAFASDREVFEEV